MPQLEKAISFAEGISRKDLKTIRQRFLRLHRLRLKRILTELSSAKQDFFLLLPLLFHINHPMLPGYVNNSTPKGLPDYNPSKRALDAAKKLSRSFSYKRRAQRIFQIEGLYLMGSTGTIAQSSSSDFDVWLCHSPSLGDDKRQLLQQKATLIEQAAKELGLELHIFPIDPERFRAGKKAKLSHDSSGSTQHSLLLEEFYRSAVLLGGRYPLWWLVPPEHELNYREYADHLLLHRFVRSSEVIDLGGLDQVPADEFFGAALWQLYKGIDSPYKSILKIFLMEAYSQDYPQPLWLSQQAKEAVYADETDIDQLDAYILLYLRVEEYLSGINDQDRLDLARRCFYFKVGEKLSGDADLQHWRSKAIFQLTRQWGWGQSELQLLDSRSEWKIDQVIKERNILVGVLSRSYRLLTDFARKYAEQSRIDPMELNLLGRKLYTALDHRPGKIDHINPGISSNLAEPQLSLHHRLTQDGSLAWMLYQGQVNEDEVPEHRPIKISIHLIEILLWSHINQVWGRETRLSLFPETCSVNRRELLELHRGITRLFPEQRMTPVSIQTLNQPATACQTALFINIGIDPLEHLSKAGKQLTSDRHDPLSFASTRSNLAIDLEELLVTSWGELLVTRREGSDGLLNSLCSLLNLQGAREAAIPQIHAYSFSSIRGSQIAGRVVELFKNIAQHFRDASNQHGRYTFRLSSEFFIVQRNEKGFEWRSLESFENLMEDLSQPQAVFRGLTFDPKILVNSPYPTLYSLNRADVIQLFFHLQPQQIQIYLLDEQGALFQQSLVLDSPRFLMLQQRRFINSLHQLRNLLPGEESNLLSEPEFYELVKAHDGEWLTERRRVPLTRPDDYMELSVVTDRLDATARPLSLICGAREFSRLEYGEEIYQATASYLHSLREGSEIYPIYLTSLCFSGVHQMQPPSTVELLNLKKRLERQLNQVPRVIEPSSS